MNAYASHDRDRSDRGSVTIPPDDSLRRSLESALPSDIQPSEGTGDSSEDLSEELPDFDPAPSYERDIRDGRIRNLTPAVHTSTPKTPRQGDPTGRETDRLLVARLAEREFSGREYDLVIERFVKTGYRYCLSWLRNGKMHKKCCEAGRPVGEFPEGVEGQEIKDLATDTAVGGSVLFRRVALIGRGWRPDGGASLLTFYVGACIHVYPTIYRKWYRQYHRNQWTEPHEALPESSCPDTDDYVILKTLLKNELDEPTWVALKMKAEKASYQEIGTVLGKTVKQVEYLLKEGRKKAAQLLAERSGDHHV